MRRNRGTFEKALGLGKLRENHDTHRPLRVRTIHKDGKSNTLRRSNTRAAEAIAFGLKAGLDMDNVLDAVKMAQQGPGILKTEETPWSKTNSTLGSP